MEIRILAFQYQKLRAQSATTAFLTWQYGFKIRDIRVIRGFL